MSDAQQITIAEMRAAAVLLERFNDLYSYDMERGTWSPLTLRYEATYLEAHP